MVRKAFFGLILVFATMLVATAKEETPVQTPRAAILEIKGAIGPATAQYLSRAFESARKKQVDLIILQMNTPGGLVASTRDIITEILTAPVPVVGYVSPGGAHAASAGTYILYATHVAAMAPATNLGAATPVNMSGPGLPGQDKKKPSDEQYIKKTLKKAIDKLKADQQPGKTADDKKSAKKDNSKGEDDKSEDGEKQLAPADPMKAKMINDMVAYIRGLAQLRGRNADWAEKAVREAASLPSKEALEQNVIDLTARDLGELLEKIDGRVVEVGKTKVTIKTKGMITERIEPDWQMKFLGVITNPNVAFILMLIGIYGIIFEFWHPGLVGPGVIGGVCLLLGLYAMNILPLNYTGAGLVLLGLAFMTAEAFIPSFGILGIGGLIAFVVGSTLLFDADSPEFQLSWVVIASTALFSGLLFAIVLGVAWRSMRRPITSGAAAMVGTLAEILEWSKGEGFVWADGERWKASGDEKLKKGQHVEIKEVEGLNLVVGPTANREG
jgi:membrane-bound serine protease (ClpP class)